MSASPSGLPNGQNLPPKGAPPLRRKARAADPLVARKKPKPKPHPAVLLGQNGGLPSGPAAVKFLANRDGNKKLYEFDAKRRLNNGWTDARPPPEAEPCDYPLVTTKRALREGIRFHVMRFASKAGGNVEQDIDPSNQSEFTRPVSLHRRDARQPPPGRAVKEEAPQAAAAPVDDKEAERLAQVKAEREAQRAIDMAQIAPSVKEAPQKRAQQKKERSLQVLMAKSTAEQKKEQEIRYEEALPWHLEDADGKNVWVGSYISALSEANVAFVISGSGFRMVPLEKYYRFSPKPPFQPYSIEEAETILNKKVGLARWAMRDKEKKKAEEEYEATRVFMGGRTRVKQESATYRSAPRSEKVDGDDIDMEGDEFQDDDENVGLEPDNDEDSKESRERMRRDQLGANLFGDANEQEVEKEETDKMMAELRRKLEGKTIRKALSRRERHHEYENESEDEESSSVSLPRLLRPTPTDTARPRRVCVLILTGERRATKRTKRTRRRKTGRRRMTTRKPGRNPRTRPAPELRPRALPRRRASRSPATPPRNPNPSSGPGRPTSPSRAGTSRPAGRRRSRRRARCGLAAPPRRSPASSGPRAKVAPLVMVRPRPARCRTAAVPRSKRSSSSALVPKGPPSVRAPGARCPLSWALVRNQPIRRRRRGHLDGVPRRQASAGAACPTRTRPCL